MNLQKLCSFFIKTSKYSTSANNSVSCIRPTSNGLLLGVYSRNEDQYDLTDMAQKYNNHTCNRLWDLLQTSGRCPRLGETRVFYGLDKQFTAAGIVGLGPRISGCSEKEGMDLIKENIRVATGTGIRAFENLNFDTIHVESFSDAEAAAEGAGLGVWNFQKMKSEKNRKSIPALELYDETDEVAWSIGLEKAAAQNLARSLAAMPSNVMTPIAFCQTAVEILCKIGVKVEVNPREWAEAQGMGGFLAVAKGTSLEPIFMEIDYCGTEDTSKRPIALVGLGTTFNSGGVCPNDIIHMSNNLTGAACVVAIIKAAASLELKVNLRGIIPLTEHMPGCFAMRPGDVVTFHNGKHAQLQDTRCAGELMLADALAYAQKYQPLCIIDIGTMTKGIHSGLGTSACAVFTNSERLWNTIELSGAHTGDRVWRMPLFRHYCKKLSCFPSVDLSAMGRPGPILGRHRGSCGSDDRTCLEWSGEPCRTAAFLREFVPCGEWLHIDNFGVMSADGVHDPPYYKAGMTGRPTRTLIEFLYQLIQAPVYQKKN